MTTARRWSRGERETLLRHFDKMPVEELAEMLPGRSIFAIEEMARVTLGLRSRRMTSEDYRARAERERERVAEEMSRDVRLGFSDD